MNCERHIGTIPETIPRSLTVSDDDSGDVDAVNADVDPRLAFKATCCEHSTTMKSGNTLPDEGRPDVVADAFMPLPNLSQPDSLVHNDRIIMEIPVRYNSNVWDTEFDDMHLHLGLLKGVPPRSVLVQDPFEARFGWREASARGKLQTLLDEGVAGGTGEACVPMWSSFRPKNRVPPHRTAMDLQMKCSSVFCFAELDERFTSTY